MTLELIWGKLEDAREYGASQRVDASGYHDFYCSLDEFGRRGLILFASSAAYLKATSFSAVEVVILRRSDGMFSIAMWLNLPSLKNVFTSLCQDLIDTSSSATKEEIAEVVLGRIARWRRLLEPGKRDTLSEEQLRGLVGELLVFRQCLTIWPPAECVRAWVGPLGSAHDFKFADKELEVKCIRPMARTVRIASAEQLDAAAGVFLELIVVELTGGVKEMQLAFTLPDLVNTITQRLSAFSLLDTDFKTRLQATGYSEQLSYAEIYFVDRGFKVYRIVDEFPRIRRSLLTPAISNVQYEISLALCGAPIDKLGREPWT